MEAIPVRILSRKQKLIQINLQIFTPVILFLLGLDILDTQSLFADNVEILLLNKKKRPNGQLPSREEKDPHFAPEISQPYYSHAPNCKHSTFIYFLTQRER